MNLGHRRRGAHATAHNENNRLREPGRGGPETVLDIVDHCVDRVLDLIGLPATDAKRWDGARKDEE